LKTQNNKMLQERAGFSAERFSKLKDLTHNHFWFAGRQRLVAKTLDRFLSRKVQITVDVGCGPGTWLESWLGYSKTVLGIEPFSPDVNTSALPEGCEMVAGLTSELPVPSEHAGLAVLLDVLEHVDDLSALKEVERVLMPNGFAIITVPAYPWLWSFRDDDAGHLRRYTRRSLTAVIDETDLRIKHIQYYQGLLLPLVILSRLFGKKASQVRDAEDTPPTWLNKVLRAINLFEVNSNLRLPFGSSLVLLVQKER